MTPQRAERLNLGCGPSGAPGWTNIDRSPNVTLQRLPWLKGALRRAGLISERHMTVWDPSIVRADIRNLPYPDGSISAIYSSHTLEHLYLDEAQTCLNEARRVLRPDGILRLALPDSVELARALVAADGSATAARTFNQELIVYPTFRPTLLTRLRRAAGGHVHRWQPTFGLVEEMLGMAGFTQVKQQSFQCGELPDLLSVETRDRSFFVEARP